MRTRTVVARGALATVGIIAALSLTSCLPTGGEPMPTVGPPLPGPSESSMPTSSPTPSASATAAPDEKPTPVSIACNSVVSAQTMYDFNPNFGLLASFSPDAGTVTAQAVAYKGTACRWINQTSSDTIDVAISSPGAKALAAAKTSASSGTPVSGLGDNAYFSNSGGVGLIQVFDGPYWITATSVYFSAPGDAHSIISSAVNSTH